MLSCLADRSSTGLGVGVLNENKRVGVGGFEQGKKDTPVVMPGSAPSPLFRRRPNRPSSSAAFASPKRGQDFNLCLHSNQQRSGDTCNYPPTHTYTGALCVVLCVFRYPIACGCHDFGVGLGAMEDLIDWGLSCLHLNLTTNLIKPRPLAGPG